MPSQIAIIAGEERFRAEVRQTWDASPNYRTEFGAFDTFLAYTRALVLGKVSRVRPMGQAVQGRDQ